MPQTAREKSIKATTKSGLRTMRKTHAKHPLREEGRIVKYGTKGFARNIGLSIAATLVMTITLIVVFATVISSVVLSDMADSIRERIEFTVYLKPDTSDETLKQLTEIIQKDTNVKSVKTNSSSEEYQKLLAEKDTKYSGINLDEEVLIMTAENIYATMSVKVYNEDKVDNIKEIIETDETFKKALSTNKEPSYNDTEIKETINQVSIMASAVQIIGIVVAAILLAIAILVIFNTIRMSVFSRREEIYMMKLVGADKRFIRGPFLVEAEISGIIAGLAAATICYVVFERFIQPWLLGQSSAEALEAGTGFDASNIINVMNSNQLVLVFLAFVAVGFLIGRISAWFALRKYLKKA